MSVALAPMVDADVPVAVRLVRPAQRAAAARVLLLHGLASTATSWDGYLPRAAAGQEVWVADLPWRGEGVAGWAQRPEVTGWLAEALSRMPSPNVVVAHSFAANVLLQLLSTVDDWRPAGLVFVSPFYRPRAEDFDWPAISYYLNDFDRILADGIRVRSAGRVTGELRQQLALRVRERVGPYGWLRFFDSYLATPYLRLDRITTPCLVVGGHADFAAFPADSVNLAANLPSARADVLPDCGHFPMAERPDEFAGLVNAFIEHLSIESIGE